MVYWINGIVDKSKFPDNIREHTRKMYETSKQLQLYQYSRNKSSNALR